MSELWSAQQREWLQAMGHTVLALAGAEVQTQAQTASEPASAQGETGARGDERSGRSAGGDIGGRAAPARDSADSALLRNLLRAARRGAGDPQVLALFDAQALRGNAAAKRALWPQLRGLRCGSARG